MKKITNIILCAILVVSLSMCKDDPVFDLILSEASLVLEKGEVTTISVEAGNGNYTVESSDNMIAKVAISGSTVAIYGLEGGSAIVSITDELGKVETISVTVSYRIPTTPRLVWNGIVYEFDKPNGPGISILNNMIAVNSLPETWQYILSWDGGLSEGEKENGQLVIARPDFLYQDNESDPIELISVRVVRADPIRGYYLVFNDGNRNGELLFTK